MPSLKELAFCDLDREFAKTRKVLERIPQQHFAFKPHEKSMDFGRLAMHVATMPQWMLDTIVKDELDLSTAKGPPTDPISPENLLATFDRISSQVKDAMKKLDDSALSRTWTLRKGEQVLYTNTKAYVLRIWCVNHMVHHRAQLCIYLRLLNLPVPAVYFNSSDEPQWSFE